MGLTDHGHEQGKLMTSSKFPTYSYPVCPTLLQFCTAAIGDSCLHPDVNLNIIVIRRVSLVQMIPAL